MSYKEDEKLSATQQKLIAQQIAKWFEWKIRNIDSFNDMEDIITKIFQTKQAKQDMLLAIISWKTKYDFPWQNEKIIITFSYMARLEYTIFRERKLNLTQTALSTPFDLMIDWKQMKGCHPDYFILGLDPEGAGIVTGPKGSGKSGFVANYIVGPATKQKNMMIVHNMNLVDPIEKKKEELMEFVGKNFNYINYYKLDDSNSVDTTDDDIQQIIFNDDSKFKFIKDFDYDTIEYQKVYYLKEALAFMSSRHYNPIFFEEEDIKFRPEECIPDDDHAIRLKNCVYCCTIEDSLLAIINHAIKGIEETGKPYSCIWIVDEAGIFRGKQRSMENRLMFHKWLTLLSRKLGCFELSIYQLDDATKELKAFATHLFHKPSRKMKGRIESQIDSTEFIEDSFIDGILDWKQLKKNGDQYVEFGTYDISTMMSTFNLMSMFDFINQISKDGKPVKTIEQFKRIKQFIETSKNVVSSLMEFDEVLILILRQQEYFKSIYARLKEKTRMTESEEKILKKVKIMKQDDTAVFSAKALLPQKDWNKTHLRDEFKRIKKQYPDCQKWESMPTDKTVLDVHHFVTRENIEQDILDEVMSMDIAYNEAHELKKENYLKKKVEDDG